MSRVPWSIDRFPVTWETDEAPPRRIVVEGNALIDPDVWVGWWEGHEHQGRCLWIIKGSGYVCHDEGNARIHAAPLSEAAAEIGCCGNGGTDAS